MDSLSQIGDRSKTCEQRTTELEEYYIEILKKNCDILKALDLNNWEQIKKKERNECVQYLKKWKCCSPAFAPEACTTSFMDSINLIEKKISMLSELKISNQMIAKSEEMFKMMEKGIKFNKENLYTLKNNYLLSRDEENHPISDLYISEKRPLIFERINELLKKSNEGEKEIEKLKQMKKQLIET